MRIFPRIRIPRFKRQSRRIWQWLRSISVRQAVTAFELVVLFGALLFLFTGSRIRFVDAFGSRGDLAWLAAALVLAGLLHRFVVPRVVSALERRFSPAPYDERRILFDLGQQARTATNIDQLYKLIVTSIAEALGAESVSILVRDEATGDYVWRVSHPALSGEISEADSDRRAMKPAVMLPRDAFIVRRLYHLAAPLTITEADFGTWESAFTSASRSLREAREKERDMLRRIKATLLLPIRIKNQVVGILSVGPRRAGHSYSAGDKEMLMSVAGQLAFVIENARLVERMVAEERLRRELALAADVQRRLFPESPPISLSLELSGFCQPARGVGGDYYDFLNGDDHRISVALADVSGKGISAALVMSNVQASLHTMTQHEPGKPAESLIHVVSTMNRLLCRSTDGATYVTFFCGQFDERTQRLTYVNAGHNPPILRRAKPDSTADDPSQRAVTEVSSGSFNGNGGLASGSLRLDAGGPVLGMFEHCLYEQETIQMRAGDLLIAYTDGVTEALNTAGEEFGEERVLEAVDSVAQESADEVRAELVKRIEDWCLGASQHDDLTFIVMKVK